MYARELLGISLVDRRLLATSASLFTGKR